MTGISIYSNVLCSEKGTEDASGLGRVRFIKRSVTSVPKDLGQLNPVVEAQTPDYRGSREKNFRLGNPDYNAFIEPDSPLVDNGTHL